MPPKTPAECEWERESARSLYYNRECASAFQDREWDTESDKIDCLQDLTRHHLVDELRNDVVCITIYRCRMERAGWASPRLRFRLEREEVFTRFLYKREREYRRKHLSIKASSFRVADVQRTMGRTLQLHSRSAISLADKTLLDNEVELTEQWLEYAQMIKVRVDKLCSEQAGDAWDAGGHNRSYGEYRDFISEVDIEEHRTQ
jgi:hypothetical protein